MTMITPSYLGETIEYSSLHACRSTLEDPTMTPLTCLGPDTCPGPAISWELPRQLGGSTGRQTSSGTTPVSSSRPSRANGRSRYCERSPPGRYAITSWHVHWGRPYVCGRSMTRSAGSRQPAWWHARCTPPLPRACRTGSRLCAARFSRTSQPCRNGLQVILAGSVARARHRPVRPRGAKAGSFSSRFQPARGCRRAAASVRRHRSRRWRAGSAGGPATAHGWAPGRPRPGSASPSQAKKLPVSSRLRK